MSNNQVPESVASLVRFLTSPLNTELDPWELAFPLGQFPSSVFLCQNDLLITISYPSSFVTPPKQQAIAIAYAKPKAKISLAVARVRNARLQATVLALAGRGLIISKIDPACSVIVLKQRTITATLQWF